MGTRPGKGAYTEGLRIVLAQFQTQNAKSQKNSPFSFQSTENTGRTVVRPGGAYSRNGVHNIAAESADGVGVHWEGHIR
jgi:hypothetical protein